MPAQLRERNVLKTNLTKFIYESHEHIFLKKLQPVLHFNIISSFTLFAKILKHAFLMHCGTYLFSVIVKTHKNTNRTVKSFLMNK